MIPSVAYPHTSLSPPPRPTPTAKDGDDDGPLSFLDVWGSPPPRPTINAQITQAVATGDTIHTILCAELAEAEAALSRSDSRAQRAEERAAQLEAHLNTIRGQLSYMLRGAPHLHLSSDELDGVKPIVAERPREASRLDELRAVVTSRFGRLLGIFKEWNMYKDPTKKKGGKATVGRDDWADSIVVLTTAAEGEHALTADYSRSDMDALFSEYDADGRCVSSLTDASHLVLAPPPSTMWCLLAIACARASSACLRPM